MTLAGKWQTCDCLICPIIIIVLLTEMCVKGRNKLNKIASKQILFLMLDIHYMFHSTDLRTLKTSVSSNNLSAFDTFIHNCSFYYIITLVMLSFNVGVQIKYSREYESTLNTLESHILRFSVSILLGVSSNVGMIFLSSLPESSTIFMSAVQGVKNQ